MRTLLCVVGLAIVTPMASGADDLKVSQLEQDVRDLQRQVQALARQLEQKPQTFSTPVPPGPRAGEAPGSQIPRWVDAAKWQRVQPGMGELQVLEVLGPPTSLRTEGAERVLLYALEMGGSGFLSGSVRLRDRMVVSVRTPALQ